MSGQELLAQAAKKENYTSFFGGNKTDDAIELYVEAANCFKLNKQVREAGNAFMKAAQLCLKINEPDDASTKFVEASKCFKKDSPKDCVECLKQAIQLLTPKGRFHMAAKYQKEIASLYENELNQLNEAIDAYILAGDWYAMEDSQAYLITL